MTLTVGIYLFNEVEDLGFADPFEVFSIASRVYSVVTRILNKLRFESRVQIVP